MLFFFAIAVVESMNQIEQIVLERQKGVPLSTLLEMTLTVKSEGSGMLHNMEQLTGAYLNTSHSFFSYPTPLLSFFHK